ncbi:MAG: carboxypeptidase-like regulatory domain-containing protein [Bacteroidales bacterium]|nr:carboxypeptidase-like regulatory domain-containing protein [Bacteroidales bacterium]
MNQLSFLSYFRNKLSLIVGIAGIILICSCTEDDPEPLFNKSVIEGHISHNNGDSPGEVKIVAKGPYGQKSTSTDSSADYWISELGNGTYELEISEEGYGTWHCYGIQLFGNDTVTQSVMLYEKISDYSLPGFHDVYDHTDLTGFNENELAVETNQGSGDIPARVFFDNQKDVNFKNYEYTQTGQALSRNGFDNLLFRIDISQLHYESGQEVYFIVYVCNPYDPGYINDYEGVMTFSTLKEDKHSEVMSFTMP